MKEILIAFYYVSTFLIFYIIGRFFDISNYFKPYVTDANRLYIFIGLSVIAFLWIVLQNWIRIYNLSTHISSKVIMILTPIVLLSYTFFPISEFETIDNNDLLIIIISIISTTLFYLLLALTHLIFPKKSNRIEKPITIIEMTEEEIVPDIKVKKIEKLDEITSSPTPSSEKKEPKVIPLTVETEPIVENKNTPQYHIDLKIQQLYYQKERLTNDTPVNNFVKSYIDKRIAQLKTQK